ncbi:hypothetical protein [Thioalkalivibrio sp. ALJT]|uniref:hypothetical protein n=1 Tax=Thioalkalivibrio sp. ALJT TaxID=1158146 RepID=UPI000379CE96|nr:hypothetical protein [Thioalkalivibrio sp. ALJT]
MRWVVLILALLNAGYLLWAWHDGRLDPDPYADVPAPESGGREIELREAWLRQAPDSPAAQEAAGESGESAGPDRVHP